MGYQYLITLFVMLIGMYSMICSADLIKRLMGMAMFQTSVIVFYMLVAHLPNSVAPIILDDDSGVVSYVNPVPHVLMLTAIVVGLATLSVGLFLIIRINKGTEK